VEAVVMAAGEGTRLRPITERYAKPVLPIDGRPVIVTLLHELRSGGVEGVVVVVGHLGEQVRALLAGFPLDLRFAEQPEALGSGDAVARAEAEPPYLVLGADTVFSAGDVGRFAAAVAGADGAVAVRRVPAPDPSHRHGVGVEDGRVVRFHADSSPLSGAPLWMVGTAIHGLVLERPGSPPWELGTAFQQAVDAGLDVRGVEIGTTRDLTYPLDLVQANFDYLRGL
jgi:UDP-N-acetylglucosamine diphosphorylase / glucose-1-phosphate thymidylyltransferase / UDP-N-acetylgalactosamine diphosphorylase / glucosamine-1-phosphate N-acetyltransferase / galactosamine-1-phosphate N-acetyltransferase